MEDELDHVDHQQESNQDHEDHKDCRIDHDVDVLLVQVLRPMRREVPKVDANHVTLNCMVEKICNAPEFNHCLIEFFQNGIKNLHYRPKGM